MKKRNLILISLIALILVVFTIFYLFNYETCESLDCFNENFIKCSRAKYLHSEGWAYEYFINGEKEGDCSVEVTLKFAGSEPKFDSIVGEKMECLVPLRKIDLPEKDLDYCSGPLKEELQFLIIKDLYIGLTENIER
jgi:hypothetical protein